MTAMQLDPRITNTDAITTHLYTPKVNEPGVSSFDLYTTFDEFEAQVKRTLQNMFIDSSECNAYECAESFYVPRALYADRDTSIFKDSAKSIFAVPSHGHCEGFVVRLLLCGSDNQYHLLISLKYFIDQDDVWRIARQLSDALNEGLI